MIVSHTKPPSPAFSSIFAGMGFWKEIIRMVRPYQGYAFLSIMSNFFAVIFSLFSLTMLLPFLDLLFDRSLIQTESPVLEATPESINLYIQYLLGGIILEKGKTGALAIIAGVIILLFLIKNVFRYLGMYYMSPLRNGIVRDLREMVYLHTLILPLSFYAGKRTGDVITRMTHDVQEVEWSVMSFLIMFFREPIALLIFTLALLLISPWLTLLALVLIPLVGYIIHLVSKSLQHSATLGQERVSMLTSILEETIQGIRIIKSFNAISVAEEKYQKSNQNFTQVLTRVYRQRDLSSPLTEILVVLVLITVMYYGGIQVLSSSHGLDAGVFLLYLAIFSQIIPPAKSLITAYYNIRKGETSMARINSLLNEDEVIIEKQNANDIKNINKNILFENVCFSYQADPVLININLEIRKGESIAIVGASGSGKSSLLNLIPRFYEPTEGRILIDGTDIRDLNISSLRALTGLVSQETILFNDSVRQNILMGLENVAEEDILQAARVANAHEFIQALPLAYDTLIGDRGIKLSGGQRQRLALARAVLRNPPLLLLDEATSALDSQSELLVQEAIDQVMKNRTSIIVAHRLSTIRKADRIIVLDKGRIIEEGNHSTLIANKGAYYQLWNMQS